MAKAESSNNSPSEPVPNSFREDGGKHYIMVHLINRLQLEVTCPHEQQAFHLQQNFAQTFQTQIAAVVEKICTQYVKEDEYLQVDQLEIVMGQFSLHSLETSFSDIFLQKFEEAIIEKLSMNSSSVRIQSYQHSTVQLLQYFLQTGTLPWWAGNADIDPGEVMVSLLDKHQQEITSFLLKHRFTEVLWQRVALQFNKEAKSQLIGLFPELKQATELFEDLLKKLIIEINQSSITSASQIVVELNRLINKSDDFIITDAPVIFAARNSQEFKTIFTTTIEEIFKVFPTAYQLFKPMLTKVAASIALPGETLKRHNELNNIHGVRENVDEIISEKLVVKHAGIILLAAYLKTFFTSLQYLQGNGWISKETQSRAVYLLKYLSTGNQKMFEYQLVLEKLLCGVPVGEPIDAAITLTKEEMAEGELLLQSVIEHWSVLKNTSVNGLRESFLKRDGILTNKENGWLLQVERKTLDVLVDKIPWGFSTVHLSWNNYIISTEW